MADEYDRRSGLERRVRKRVSVAGMEPSGDAERTEHDSSVEESISILQQAMGFPAKCRRSGAERRSDEA